MKKWILAGMVVLGGAALSLDVCADTVVDFDPSSDMTLQRTLPATETDSAALGFDAENPLLNGGGQNNKSYGGISYYTSGGSSTAFDKDLVYRFSDTAMRYGVVTPTGQATDPTTGFTVVQLWDSADFLGHSAGNTYQYGVPSDDFTTDSNSKMSLTYSYATAPGSIRFIIRDDSQYYVSSVHGGTDSPEFDAGNNRIANNITQNNLKWAAFDVADIMDFDGLVSDYGFSDTLVFEDRGFYDVTGVGYIANVSRPNKDGEGARLDMNDFTADLHVIPEPATLGLVALFSVGAFFIRRRFML